MSAKKKGRKSMNSSNSGGASPLRSNSDAGDSDTDLQYVPVTTPQKRTQQGNLTGPERKVKDNCADWHNHAEKWKLLVAKGAAIVTEISNHKISTFSDDDYDKMQLFETLQKLSKDLEQTFDSLQKLVHKMSRLTETFRGLNQLTQCKNTPSEILFQTWPLDKFVDVSDELYEMYRKELEVKKCVVENVCHSKTREMAMCHISVWVHDPYIDRPRHEFLIESMILEVGLK